MLLRLLVLLVCGSGGAMIVVADERQSARFGGVRFLCGNANERTGGNSHQ